MNNNPNERSFWISKDGLDTVNSVAWFFMDAFWMLGLAQAGLFFIIPTVLTGLGLLYIEKRPAVLKINIAINCWIWMNVLWMASDAFRLPGLLDYSKAMFAAGVGFIVLAGAQSGNLKETFSHFRRFRTVKWLGAPDGGRV
jgi:hypothetical protein